MKHSCSSSTSFVCRLSAFLSVAAPMALTLLVFLLSPSPGFGDWLVTHQGERIETQGPWRIEQEAVVFTAPNGNLQSLAISEIDFRRSRLLTGGVTTQAIGDVDPSFVLQELGPRTLTPAGSDSANVLDAREEWAESRFSPRRFEARVKVGSFAYDNLFQAPDDELQEETRSTDTELRLTWRLGKAYPLKSYLQLNRAEFEDLPVTSAYGVGIRVDGRKHYLDLFTRFEKDRRALDIGDDFEEAEILKYHAGYSLRFHQAWEWGLSTDFRDQDFDVSSAKDSKIYEVGTALRYRGFGRHFSPEIGTRWGERETLSDADHYTQQDLYLKLRFSPVRVLAFSVRFRDRDRDYDVRDPTARTFARKDTRQQWTFSGDILLQRNLAFNLYYDYLEGDSTDSGRVFTTQTLVGGLTFKIGSTSHSTRPRIDEPPKTLRPHQERPEVGEPSVVAESPVETEELGRHGEEDQPLEVVNDGLEEHRASERPAVEGLVAPQEINPAAFVEAWAGSWFEQRTEDYLSFYSGSFEPADGMPRGAWEELRRTRVSTPSFITITVESLVWEIGDGSVSVTFKQSYQSNTYADVVTKTLELTRERDEWKIIRETAVPLDK